MMSIDSELEVQFVENPACAKSVRWMVFVDEAIKKWCVGIGGAERKQTFDGKFLIRRLNEGSVAYKLVFCVSGSHSCEDIGKFDAKNGENGKRLILTDKEPYGFVLQRVLESTLS